jgi:VanZ family protein
MALIYLLSAQSQLPTPHEHWLDVVLEKAAHTTEYLVLSLLMLRAVRETRSVSRALSFAVLLSFVYALSDELHQRFVPGRSSDWKDIVFDWLGVLAGAWLWHRFRTSQQPEQPSITDMSEVSDWSERPD